GGPVRQSHLGVTGMWGGYGAGRRGSRSARRGWIVLRGGGAGVVGFDGPLRELMTGLRVRSDQRLASLGADVLAPAFDAARFVSLLRCDDPPRQIGDALLDQRNVAGIGNIWKAEGCWEALVDPWRRVGDVSDSEALAIISGIRPRMLLSA